MKGDYFTIFRKKDGNWHWELHKGYSPYGPMARSRMGGYRSENAVRSSIKSACNAAIGAWGNGKPRIELKRAKPSN